MKDNNESCCGTHACSCAHTQTTLAQVFAQYPLPKEVIDTYQGLIFDMDGTCINTLDAHYQAWIETGRHFGYEFDAELDKTMTGSSARDILTAMMKKANMPLDRFDEVYAYRNELGVKTVGKSATAMVTFDVAKYYSKTDKPIAMGTGSQQIYIVDLDPRFHLREVFHNHIVTSDDVEHAKPAPDTWLKCAQLIGVDPQHCLVFEDGNFGVQAALTAKMDAYQINERILYKANGEKIKY